MSNPSINSIEMYDGFIFDTYEQDFRCNEADWNKHYQRLTAFFETAIQNMAELGLTLGLIGCGIAQIGRELPTDLISRFMATGKIKKIHLVDISSKVIAQALNNLMGHGMVRPDVDFSLRDITLGAAEQIGNQLITALMGQDLTETLQSLRRIRPCASVPMLPPPALHLHLIYSPMTLLATLNPFVIKAFKMLPRLGARETETNLIESEVLRIWFEHNE